LERLEKKNGGRIINYHLIEYNVVDIYFIRKNHLKTQSIMFIEKLPTS
jgi:hypothetical protein